MNSFQNLINRKIFCHYPKLFTQKTNYTKQFKIINKFGYTGNHSVLMSEVTYKIMFFRDLLP